MSRDFQQTHENLLLCAQKHFLEYGFERASIREICKDAHVTNGAFYNHFDDKEALFGALVEPVVQEVKAIYEASVNEHIELAKTDDLKSLWKLSKETLSVIIEYIYEHFDVFRLLLAGAGGSSAGHPREESMEPRRILCGKRLFALPRCVASGRHRRFGASG